MSVQRTRQDKPTEADAARRRQHQQERTWIFLYDVCAFLVLALMAWLYLLPASYRYSIQPWVPPALQGVPIEAFWFGALGGVVISLKGVYDHGVADWQERFDLWHLGRPLSGGIAGGVMLVLLQAVSGDTGPRAPVVLAAAFIIGTQERRFFNFLSEVARLIVQVPGDAQAAPLSVSEFLPTQGSEGDTVTILGQGFQPGSVAVIGSGRLGSIVVNREGTTITGTVPPGSGPESVRVENPDGLAFIADGKFTYVPPRAAANLTELVPDGVAAPGADTKTQEPTPAAEATPPLTTSP